MKRVWLTVFVLALIVLVAAGLSAQLVTADPPAQPDSPSDPTAPGQEYTLQTAMRDGRMTLSTFGIDAAPGERDFGVAGGWLVEGKNRLLSLNDMPVAGLHNAANALAAFALCRAIGCEAEMLATGLREFKGLPHRVENVGVINGVTFYDDSKGTNVGSTVAALNGMTVPVILIAGGIGKEQDFAPLAEPVRKRARSVVLIGKDARLIESAITSARAAITQIGRAHV